MSSDASVPSASQPSQRYDYADTEMGHDPLYRALRVYTLAVRGIFASRPVGHLRWSSDPASTELVITTSPPVTEQRPLKPAILLSRQAATTNIDDTRIENLARGIRTSERLVSSAISLVCVAREPAVASQISWIVFENLPLLAPTLQRWGSLFMVATRISLSSESPPQVQITGGPYQDWSSVTITAPFNIVISDRVQDSDPSRFHSVLRAVTMTLEAAMGPLRSRGEKAGGPAVDMSRELTVNPPMYRGRPVRTTHSLDHPSTARAGGTDEARLTGQQE